MRILSVLVRHGLVKYPGAEEDLDALYRRQLPGVDREVIVVDNAMTGGVIEERPGRTLIGGDNSSQEFSGFDRAIAHAGPRIWDFDLVQLGTSAFQMLFTRYLDCFSLPLLDRVHGRSVCLGHIDCYNEPIGIFGYQSQHWVRTSFFVLPVAEVRALRGFVSVRADGLFSGDPREPFAPDAPLDPRYRRYLIDWLAGRDIGQGVAWHSRLTLTADTLPEFEQRARAIMNEHMLGVRLRAAGCRLIDVTWLSQRLAESPHVDWRAGWAEQLAARRIESP